MAKDRAVARGGGDGTGKQTGHAACYRSGTVPPASATVEFLAIVPGETDGTGVSTAEALKPN